MIKPYLFYIFGFVSILFVVACAKIDLEPPILEKTEQIQNITNKNGALCFRNAEVFIETLDQIISGEASLDLEKKYLFKSLATHVDEILDSINKTQTPLEYENFLRRNKTHIKEVDDFLLPAVESYAYRLIANSKGEYYINDTLYQVTPDHLFVTIINPKTKAAEKLKLLYACNNNSLDTKAEKVDIQIDERYENKASDRAVYFKMQTFFYYTHIAVGSKNQYTGRFSIQAYVQGSIARIIVWKKKWSSYNTRLFIDNLVFRFSIPGYPGSLYELSSLKFQGGDNRSYDSGTDVKSYTITFNDIQQYTFTDIIKQPEISLLRARARSRGTGDCGPVVNVPYYNTNWPILEQCK